VKNKLAAVFPYKEDSSTAGRKYQPAMRLMSSMMRSGKILPKIRSRDLSRAFNIRRKNGLDLDSDINIARTSLVLNIRKLAVTSIFMQILTWFSENATFQKRHTSSFLGLYFLLNFKIISLLVIPVRLVLDPIKEREFGKTKKLLSALNAEWQAPNI
jgi:hypothetical protein